MLILHMADLHLGRTLHDAPLFADQKQMLDSALGYIAARAVDVLLIAGDVYDRSIPQPEAIGLFDQFLTAAFAEQPGLSVIVIPGNHDSAARLSFGSGLLQRARLYIKGRSDVPPEPVRISAKGLSVNFWALPYMEAGALESAVAEIKKSMGAAAAPGSTGADMAVAAPGGNMETELRNVLLAHCFVSGCAPSESERAVVGLAEEIPASVFEGFDYVALGHLHRRQAAGPVARYPGSPLAYSFSEAAASPEKGFLLIDMEPGSSGADGAAFREEFLPVKPLHRLVRLEGLYADLCAEGAFPEYRGDYIEAKLTDPGPTLDPALGLRKNFPNLITVGQTYFDRLQQSAEQAVRSPQHAGSAGQAAENCGAAAVEADFRSFYEEIYGVPPPPEMGALFADLLKEAEDASN